MFPDDARNAPLKKKKNPDKSTQGTQTARKIERANIPYRAALVLQ